MITRRRLLEASGALLAAGSRALKAEPLAARDKAGEALLSPLLPAGTRAEAALDTLPGKKPLIKLTYRPPNYEAPLASCARLLPRTMNFSSATTSPTFRKSMRASGNSTWAVRAPSPKKKSGSSSLILKKVAEFWDKIALGIKAIEIMSDRA
jgi:hypothetical protein